MNPLLWNRFVYWLLGYQKKHDEYLRVLKKFSNDAIVERKAAIASGEVERETSRRKMNLLDILLSCEESKELTPEDLRQEVDTFMFAGHDTTTTSLSWTCWNLAHNPQVQEKVYQELMEIFGDEQNVTLDRIARLEYTDRVIKESKRIVAPVPGFQRKLTEDIVIDGITIPSEGTITISPTILHCNLSVYPDPEKFDPDRFLPEESEKTKRNSYDYIPFSAGLRNCIGQKFSQLNEKVMLIHLVRNFRIEPKLGYYGTKPTFEVVAKPSNGIPVKLIRRH